jgi:eukaryotic-like serine/threonine-protein kinase
VPNPSVRVETPSSVPSPRGISRTTLESPGTVTTAPPPARPPWKRWWPVAAFAALGFVGAMTALPRLIAPPSAVAPAPTAAPTTAPTPITELPPPSSTNLEALSAYREGLQGFRDASWGLAYAAFGRAAKLDPALGAAHLRLALIDYLGGNTAGTRASFARAAQLRGGLSERDQRLLDALEPLIQRDPPGVEEAAARIEAASAQYSGDAELVYLSIVLRPQSSPDKVLALAERCLELDPQYADCWQARAITLFQADRITDALDVLDRCVTSAPSATDCLVDRIRIHKYIGRCDRLEPDARLWLARNQDSPLAYQELAVALHASGRPAAAVTEAAEQAARRFEAANLPEVAAKLRVHLALLTGDFEMAEQRARALDQALSSLPLEEKRVTPAIELVRIYGETGQDRKAGEVAARFLSQRAAWTRPTLRLPFRDPTVTFLDAERRAKLIDEAAYISARDAWYRDALAAPQVDRNELWLMAEATPAHTAESARHALESSPPRKALAHYALTQAPMVDALLGNLYVLAGRSEDAIPHLDRVARSCTALDEPIRHTVATYQLGLAFEALHEKPRACESYNTVIQRWGRASRSETAKSAVKHAKALGCKP